MKTTRMLLIVVLALVVGLPAGVANADFTFGTPTNLGPTVNSSNWDLLPSISTDGLTLYFASRRPGGYGNLDIWVTTRETTDDDWGEPVNLGPIVNSSSPEWGVSISSDGLSLYFSRGGVGVIWLTTRATTDDDWGNPVNLGPTVNSSSDDFALDVSADDLSLYFTSNRGGGYGRYDLWVTTRETIHGPWGTPVNLGPTVNSSYHDVAPGISADGLSLFFMSTRPGGAGNFDLWVTMRASTDDDWGTPVNLGPTVNSSTWDAHPAISADGSTIFFMSERPGGLGGYDLWQVSIVPIVDFNGDGIVDSTDMCIMVDYWGTDEPLCDIGPMPWGDGIVDVQDLIVLAEHLFEDYRLAARWKLDETEGDIAYDSVATNDAVVIGDAIWQPDGGQVNGALAFDGTDDYLSTDFVLNPMDGAFSVFVWIKGGAPGQVILSQVDAPTERGLKPGSTWLGTDPSEGKFMAGLTHAVLPLVSESVITDGNWHDIGLVYDGSSKYLYVDGAEVAKDDLDPLLGNDGGLYIGAGKNLEPGSFFSGLIDDVRIYNRAITP